MVGAKPISSCDGRRAIQNAEAYYSDLSHVYVTPVWLAGTGIAVPQRVDAL